MKSIIDDLTTLEKAALNLTATLLLATLLILASAPYSHAITPWYATVGAHTVLLNPDGTVWCIGSNNHGQLGIGTIDSAIHEPVLVTGFTKVKAVAAGASHSVALRKDGTVWTWGRNEAGQLGTGNRIDSATPVQVDGLRDIIAIASGRNHVVALKKDGTVWAWGSNQSGQLGIDSSGISETPVQTTQLANVTAIAAGAYHSAALKSDGTVWAWGFNGNGQLGNGTMESYNIPVKVTGIDSAVALSAGNQHTVALENNGTVRIWGSNHASQLGGHISSLMSLTPVEVTNLSGVRDISAKVNHTFALMHDGTVVAWGDSGSGQWGNEISMNGSSTPVRLKGVSSLVSIAAIGNPDTVVNYARTDIPAGAGQNNEKITVADASLFSY